MKKVLVIFIIFISLLFVIDFSVGKVLDYSYQKGKNGVSYQEYYSLMKTNQQLLIFGSSRAAFHYIPDVFSKKLNLSTYNVGREGVGIYYHNAVLVSLLQRYKPEVIILDLDFRDIYLQGGDFGPDVFKVLAPFYGKINHEFDSLLTRNWYDPVLYNSKMFRYNKKTFQILTSNLIKGRGNQNGFRPLVGEWKNKIRNSEMQKKM